MFSSPSCHQIWQVSCNSSLKLKSSGNTCSQFEADQACKFLGIQDVTEHLTKCARAPSAGLLAQDWQNQHLGWSNKGVWKVVVAWPVSGIVKFQHLCTWIHEHHRKCKKPTYSLILVVYIFLHHMLPSVLQMVRAHWCSCVDCTLMLCSCSHVRVQ